MPRPAWTAAVVVVCVAAVGGTLAGVARTDTAPRDHGPGVAVLAEWYAADARGDLADDESVTTAAEDAVADAFATEYDDLFLLRGEARTAFAVSTDEGAVAFVVQPAIWTSVGQTNIAPGVILPVGVGVWLDDFNAVTFTDVAPPVSQSESATYPEDAEVTVGMWADAQQSSFVLFDTGYPTSFSAGVLAPNRATPDDLVQTARSRQAGLENGYLEVDLRPDVLPGTAVIELEQRRYSNWPLLLGDAYTRALRAEERWATDELDLYIEGGGAQRPVRIKPYPAAYGGYEAQRLGRQWTRARISAEATWQRTAAGSGHVLQAELPSGHRLLLQWVIAGKAYVALVEAPDDSVVGVRCGTPGPVLTVMCPLPDDLGRLFVVDEPFRWRGPTGGWQRGRPAYFDETYAAVVPDRSTIEVTPKHHDQFRLRFGPPGQ